MSTHRSIIRSAGIIGIATLCSRLLGFIRDIVIARLFGIYMYAQAFVVAFKIPNLLRDLVGEGAANAAFVPVFSEYRLRHSREEFWKLANVVLNLMLVLLSLITIAGVLLAPVLVRLIAPGFIAEPQKLAVAIHLTRIIFPYVLLVSLAAYAVGILNTLKHFSVPAFAPCLLNISVIACALFFGEDVMGLATGVLIGGVLQLIVQVPVLYRKGFRLRGFLKDFKHPGARLIGKLMLPRLFSTSIYQLNNFVDSIFGSLGIIVGEGGVAVLYFAYRLIQFPLGIFGNALSQAILSAFSAQALEETNANLKRTLSFGLRATFFVLLPASAGFMVLAKPIISGLFGGGRFDSYSAEVTARVLFFYSIGLTAYGANKIMQSCFFALKDTMTPAKVSGLALCISIALDAVLMFPLKISGLALATATSSTVAALVLFHILQKRLGGLDTKAIFSSFVRILIASVCMGAVCHYVNRIQFFAAQNTFLRLANLLVVISAGVISYIIFCFIFRLSEIQELWRKFRGRFIPV